MQLNDFDYLLPEDLIAQQPLEQRGDSRLLAVKRDSKQLIDYQFSQLLSELRDGDLLVLNNTKVLPARLFGHKASGGKVEVLLERVLSTHEVLAQVRANRALKMDTFITIDENVVLQVVGREQNFYRLRSEGLEMPAILEQYGQMPLPPYITREANELDMQRYQTVYADVLGAVAAPTAGLHFDTQLMSAIAEKGVGTAQVTLHVGAGTFQPVRVDDIRDHHMHAEYLEVSADTCKKIQQTKRKGGRVIAIGTTSVRALETAAQDGQLKPYVGDSRLFIYPGYQFNVIDAMLTNFHLPKSTLLMLVSAFAGSDLIRTAYAHAIAERYRFFSYGDAMLII